MMDLGYIQPESLPLLHTGNKHPHTFADKHPSMPLSQPNALASSLASKQENGGETLEMEKDLTPELDKQESKDRWYQVKGTLKFLPAPQDPKTARPYTYKKTGWGSIERIEAHMAATPTTTTAPVKRKKIRTGEGEIKTSACHSFAQDTEGRVLIPWGGYGGLFKSSWRRTLQAKAARDWEYPKADLIKCYPLKLKVSGPIDSKNNGQEPLVVLTTRHTARGDVMVEEFFDWVRDRPIEFYLEVDSESPINEERSPAENVALACIHSGTQAFSRIRSHTFTQARSLEPNLTFWRECSHPSIQVASHPTSHSIMQESSPQKFVGMLKSFNTLDSFGPSKKGELRISDIKQVRLSNRELKDIGA